jgi:hypothetical protein
MVVRTQILFASSCVLRKGYIDGGFWAVRAVSESCESRQLLWVEASHALLICAVPLSADVRCTLSAARSLWTSTPVKHIGGLTTFPRDTQS